MKLLPEFGLSASGIGCSLADGWYINGFDRLRIAFLLSRSANLQAKGPRLSRDKGQCILSDTELPPCAALLESVPPKPPAAVRNENRIVKTLLTFYFQRGTYE
jgi:hypothetical protein